MRKQYHLRDSERGILAWDIDRLIILTADLPVFEIELKCIRELDQTPWFGLEGDTPTCRKISAHVNLINEADLRFPIILDHRGRVMDGMHRVCKALINGQTNIRARQLRELPEPNFVGISAEKLPYDP